MEVIVGDRQSGKTSALIDWLLEGEVIDNYPWWSRVIACTTQRRVVAVTDMVKRCTQEVFEANIRDGNKGMERTLHDIRKAVWSLGDLQANRGRRGIQVAFDDVEYLLEMILRCQPAVITLTGSVRLMGEHDAIGISPSAEASPTQE